MNRREFLKRSAASVAAAAAGLTATIQAGEAVAGEQQPVAAVEAVGSLPNVYNEPVLPLDPEFWTPDGANYRVVSVEQFPSPTMIGYTYRLVVEPDNPLVRTMGVKFVCEKPDIDAKQVLYDMDSQIRLAIKHREAGL